LVVRSHCIRIVTQTLRSEWLQTSLAQRQIALVHSPRPWRSLSGSSAHRSRLPSTRIHRQTLPSPRSRARGSCSHRPVITSNLSWKA
jgi:hypothetical protein